MNAATCRSCGLNYGPECYTDPVGMSQVCDACKRHIREANEPWQCPFCGSTNREYDPQTTQRTCGDCGQYEDDWKRPTTERNHQQ